MTTKTLEQNEWAAYFDAATKKLVHEKQPVYTEVRVMNAEIGVQTEAEWVPLYGLTYDHRENTLEIATNPVDHRIHDPQLIHVVEGDEGLPTILEVVTGDGKQVIELRY